MIDTHSHILPFIDDGAKSIEESVCLLKMQKSGGADYVVATPHFSYERTSVSEFISNREQSYNLLINEMQKHPKDDFPFLSVASEVMLTENISDVDDFDLLCMPDKKHILVELPMFNCGSWVFDKLFEISGTKNVTPVIAHIDRYMMLQSDGFIKKLIALNLPLQFNLSVVKNRAEFKKFYSFFKTAPQLFKYIGSDCHNIGLRKPDIDKYYPVLIKKLGNTQTDYIFNCSKELISV
ncbi:MAG: CpsB/CapC family capsule biosynthesis tyrosine phosphatase [Acutalibacteraceae bacterium]|nr:CpsB/CapC family capsule biosynthesis tyrosine phosphatase [Acutalibacteraceae bacterium]